MSDQNRSKDKDQMHKNQTHEPSSQRQHTQQPSDTRHDSKETPDRERSRQQQSGGTGHGQQGGRGSDNR